MPYTVTVENYQEFSQRHGNRPLRVAGRLLFVDGASTTENGECRQEPPCDPVECIRVKLCYWHEAVRRSAADFDKLKNYCSQQAELARRYSNLPGPPHAALSDLKNLRDAVAGCRDEVAKLEKELVEKTANHPDRLRRQCLEEYEREQQAAAASIVAEIANITI